MTKETFTLREIFLEAREGEFCTLSVELPPTSKTFEKRMKRISCRRSVYALPMLDTVVKRIAVILITVATVCSMPLASSAVRQAVGGFFSEIFDTFTRYQVDNTGENTNNQQKIEYMITLPDGYIEFERTVHRRSTSVRYRNAEDEEIVFYQTSDENYTTNIDNEKLISEEIIIGDFSALHFYSEYMRILLWNKDGYVFEIQMPITISIDEAIGMAKSCIPGS